MSILFALVSLLSLSLLLSSTPYAGSAVAAQDKRGEYGLSLIHI